MLRMIPQVFSSTCFESILGELNWEVVEISKAPGNWRVCADELNGKISKILELPPPLHIVGRVGVHSANYPRRYLLEPFNSYLFT